MSEIGRIADYLCILDNGISICYAPDMILIFLYSTISLPLQVDTAAFYRKISPSIFRIRANDSVGTAFAIGDGRFLVTAEHVVHGSATANLPNGKSCHVIFRDQDQDIAILFSSTKVANGLPFSIKKTPPPGTRVYAIGHALGFSKLTMSEGLVSGLFHLGNVAKLQVSAPINEGSSGCPILNEAGEVVAMAVSSIIGSGVQAINFGVSTWNLRNAYWVASEKAKALASNQRNLRPKPLGSLGQAIASSKIFASPNQESRVYYEVLPYEYLVIKDAADIEWKMVLMKTGQYGYIKASDVSVLPYEVTAKPPRLEPKSVARVPIRKSKTRTRKDPR